MFSAVHKRFQTPHISTWIAGFVVGIPAGIWDIDTFAELSNIGTLFAFVLVSLGVIVLRKKQPDRPRSFPRAVRAAFPDDLDRLLPGADGGPAADDVAAVLRLAGDRPGDLLPLRPEDAARWLRRPALHGQPYHRFGAPRRRRWSRRRSVIRMVRESKRFSCRSMGTRCA